MKVALISCFYPFRGGTSQFNAALLCELGKLCQVKAFNYTRQYPDILFPGKTQYVTENDEAIPVESTPVLDTVNYFSYRKTVRAVMEYNPDLVVVRYLMSWFAPSLGYVTRKLRKKGVKVISIVDNVIPHERHFFDEPLTRYFLSGSDACITMCDAVASDLHEIAPLKRNLTLSHPLYTHFGEALPREEALKALNLDPERKTLLFFGLIRKYKGLDILLNAFAGLPEDYQLIIAGEPYGSFDEYQALIDKIDCHDRIATHLLYIRDSEVKNYFSGADLCVLPYRSATQSGVSAVSFHFEVPMLVTAVGGLKETIADTGTGMLSESCSPEDVRKGILNYFSDPSLRENCISCIRKQKELRSWHNFASKLLELAETI